MEMDIFDVMQALAKYFCYSILMIVSETSDLMSEDAIYVHLEEENIVRGPENTEFESFTKRMFTIWIQTVCRIPEQGLYYSSNMP